MKDRRDCNFNVLNNYHKIIKHFNRLYKDVEDYYNCLEDLDGNIL